MDLSVFNTQLKLVFYKRLMMFFLSLLASAFLSWFFGVLVTFVQVCLKSDSFFFVQHDFVEKSFSFDPMRDLKCVNSTLIFLQVCMHWSEHWEVRTNHQTGSWWGRWPSLCRTSSGPCLLWSQAPWGRSLSMSPRYSNLSWSPLPLSLSLIGSGTHYLSLSVFRLVRKPTT